VVPHLLLLFSLMWLLLLLLVVPHIENENLYDPQKADIYISTCICTGISDSDPDSSDLCYRFNHYNTYMWVYVCMMMVYKGILSYERCS